MSSTRDYALRYAENGWSVLPVKPEEKRPFMQNWLQYTRNRADALTIDRWFAGLNNAGVGMVTGKVSNIVVMDVEHDCPFTIEELLKKYPTRLVSRSGSGGYHLFYQYPQSQNRVSNRVGMMDRVDLRADGGFIVLPPTIHPNGNRYTWVSEGVPGAFPLALLELQSQPKIQNDGWITEALRGVSEGGRNSTCARLAGYFFKKGVNCDIVESLLLEWNERNDPPLPAHEIRTTVRSIERSHAGASSTSQFTQVEFDGSVATEKRHSFDVLKMRDYVQGYGDGGTSWLVDDWLPDKSITFMVSPPESYKTWILLDLAVSVSTGLPFLGQAKVNRTGPVILIQQEDSHGGLAERLALITEQKMGAKVSLEGNTWQIPCIPDLPVYVHPSRMLRFDNQKVLEELEEQIEQIRPRVVLIDPLYSTTSTDNYMAQSAEQMSVLKTWRDKYGCSFVLAHHSKKNVDPDSTAREDSWGSQFLNAFLEAGWQIRRNQRLAQNEVVVRRHSKTMGNQSPVSLTFDISTRYPMRYHVVAREYETQATGANDRSMPAQSYILDAFSGREFTQKDIVDRTGKSPSTVSRQIKQLESAGLVERMPSGKLKVKGE